MRPTRTLQAALALAAFAAATAGVVGLATGPSAAPTITTAVTPDRPAVQAATFGPVVLAGAYGAGAGQDDRTGLPHLTTGSLTRDVGAQLAFAARVGGQDVRLRPIARTQHEHYTVYWQADLSPPGGLAELGHPDGRPADRVGPLAEVMQVLVHP